MKDKIAGTEEAWESRQLGADEDHVRAVSADEAKSVDDTLGLQMISIRLDRSLIETFKLIGEFHGLGYQPVMRDALKRFADHEMKQILQGVVESQRNAKESKGLVKPKKTAKSADTSEPVKKAA